MRQKDLLIHRARMKILSDSINDRSARRQELKANGATKQELRDFDKKEFEARNRLEANINNIPLAI